MAKHVCVNDKKDCCGCSACYSICPRKAIEMKADSEGFLYPHVDPNSCVECGLCTSLCQRISNRENITRLYAVMNNCHDIREESTSGGMFSALAKYVAEKKGTIYGAAFNQNFEVCHERCDDDSWTKFKGAKYVQSAINDALLDIKKDLVDNRWVLFVGTPCQVSGLLNFLSRIKISTDRLITCDLVCHGVPSPMVWRDYLKLITRNNVNTVGDVKFRNKMGCGWHNSTLKINDKEENTIVELEQGKGVFGWGFCNNIILRPSCYSCPYTNFDRVGDFTLGDFWSIEKRHSDFDDNLGTSLVMVNTTKAMDIWKEVTSDLLWKEVKCEDCVQPNLISPSKCYGDRSLYWLAYRFFGLKTASKVCGAEKPCGLMSLYYRGISFSLRILRKLLKLVN